LSQKPGFFNNTYAYGTLRERQFSETPTPVHGVAKQTEPTCVG
jgi:hypothetical protein